MQRAILFPGVTIAVAFAGVPEALEGLMRTAFLPILVVFVILMVRYIARARRPQATHVRRHGVQETAGTNPTA